MQQLIYSYAPNELERLFVEKGLEALYKGTLDSYRVRLNNTRTIIEEVVNVTQQVKDGILERNEYVREVCDEAKDLIDGQPDSLKWISLTKEFYTSRILGESSKRSNHSKIIQASKLVLSDNSNYSSQIIDQIDEEISSYSIGDDINNRNQLLSNMAFSFIELLNAGYSKQYLYQFFRTIFVHTGNSQMDFGQRFRIWKELIGESEREYQVIFRIESNKFQFRELSIINSAYEHVNRRFRAILPPETAPELKEFLKLNKREKMVSLKVVALDHYKAIEKSRIQLANDLDLYHSGFNGVNNYIGKKAGVISIENPEKASTEPSNYQLDGFTRGSLSILQSLVMKIDSLQRNSIARESINKLLAGFRYLRLGTESTALESKLLNYWIGLEYLFTSHGDEMKTIDRIREYFPICHAVIYIKRKLYAFHKAIARLELESNIANYNEDLVYLNDFSTYETVKKNSQNLLMINRANELQKWVSDPSTISRSLYIHQRNIKWNISRLYRLRNEIVHNAAIKSNIQSNVSHIRYYLSFILYSTLSFLADSPVDTNNDGSIAIEDYFIAQEIKLANLKGKTIVDYNRVNNSMEMFY